MKDSGRYVSIGIFVLGLCMFVGAETYKDFYLDLQARSSGRYIDYQALAEFCGWTGGPRPGETRLAWGLRAAWNMLSAMMGMTAVAMVAFGLLGGIIFAVFRLTGAIE